MLDFFKNGGIFLFDENDSKSELTYYDLEDLMGEEEGADITEAYLDEDGELCIYYDCSVLTEEEAIEKYDKGEYVKHL